MSATAGAMTAVELRVTPRPNERPVDPRAAETRGLPLHQGLDGVLRSDAVFAVRYADDGRIYRRALVLPAGPLRRDLVAADRDFPAFRDCAPTLLGWAARPDLDATFAHGFATDADPSNDDPDYLSRGRAEVLAAAPVEQRQMTSDLPHWGTRCRRCGAIDALIRHTTDGTVFRVRAVAQGELRSDGPVDGFAPLAAPLDAYQCAVCDAVVQGHVADDLVETVPVADTEGDGISRIGATIRAEDDWQVKGFVQRATPRGVAFSGRLLRQGREVAWFEHDGNGGAMDLGLLAAARENGDGAHLYAEIRRLAGPTAFEPEEPFILAVLERQGL